MLTPSWLPPSDWICIMSSSTRQKDFTLLSNVIITPCIGVCTLGPDDHCIGCFRTTDEICQWLNFSEFERSAIMERLPARIDRLFHSR